jgi:hypothetical protein
MRQPPGKEIYRKGTISVYEVDGKDHKVTVAAQLIFQISLVCFLTNNFPNKVNCLMQYFNCPCFILDLLPELVSDSQVVSGSQNPLF